MPLNISCTDLPSQILEKAHNATAVPSLWIGFIIYSLIFLAMGLLILYKQKAKGKFFLIWFLSMILGGIVFLGIALMPNQIQLLVNFITNAF